jgi:iron complex transport system substrate-binding protein
MRIVSLLPSLTELVCALGRGDELVGVTHECDFPTGVESLPHLTHSHIPSSISSAAIDSLVSEQGGQLYELDGELLAKLRPDLILTQAQCDVCAVNEQSVRRTAAALPGHPHVESVNPTNLAGIHAMFRRVGELVDRRDAAENLIAQFAETSAAIAARRKAKPVARVLHLEWFDPPFISGHWNPELIALAGGEDVLGRAGEPSRRANWAEIVAAAPEVIVLAPCGFSVERTEEELPELERRLEWRNLPAVRNGRVTVADGSAYFSRPGPRLETSLRIAASAIDPEACGDLAPRHGWRRLLVTE